VWYLAAVSISFVEGKTMFIFKFVSSIVANVVGMFAAAMFAVAVALAAKANRLSFLVDSESEEDADDTLLSAGVEADHICMQVAENVARNMGDRVFAALEAVELFVYPNLCRTDVASADRFMMFRRAPSIGYQSWEEVMNAHRDVPAWPQVSVEASAHAEAK
jgi:hypothetical protein